MTASVPAIKPRSGHPRITTARTANICLKQDGRPTGSALLDAPGPNGYIVEGEHFIAEHAPLEASGPGTVIVEARRHLLDFGDMTPAEIAEFGSVVHRLVPAVKAATGVERVYWLAFDGAIPALPSLARAEEKGCRAGRVAYLAQQPPLTASLTEAQEMSDRIRARL